MTESIFLVIIGLYVTILSYIGVTYFPSERFQFLATIPYKKISDGRWLSLNITYYGLFNALGYTTGAFVVTLLLLSIGLNFIEILLIMALIFAICIPSSKIIAYFVEKSRSGFTVGGAVFVGVVIAPVAIFLTLYFLKKGVNIADYFIPILASMSVGYIFGEGIGRIGCLSFGCCYGKDLDTLKNPLLKRIFSRFYTVYTGKLKKAHYSSQLCNKKTVPVQTMGIILYNSTGLITIFLFLNKFYFMALIINVFVSQFYRFFSEFLRADYRGEGEISVYQKMSIFNIIAVMCYSYLFGNSSKALNPDLLSGLSIFSEIKAIMPFLILLTITFIYTGVSTATYSITDFKLSLKVKSK